MATSGPLSRTCSTTSSTTRPPRTRPPWRPPWGGELAAALAEVYSKGFDQPYNAVLAVYDYQFEGSRYVPGAPARFVGSFSYIER